ncbi:Alanine racemase N-terminal, partial [Trinorchestia longiramus]
EKLWCPPDNRSWKGKLLCDVTTPAFLLDKQVAERNCTRMLDTCRQLGVQLRAQTKTHKTIEGVDLQTAGTRRCLVSSTLDECEFLADHSCDDLLFGHPLTAHHLPRVTRLTKALQDFHVMVDSDEAMELLTETPPPEGRRWSVFLKVDCGKRRAGVWHEDVARGCALVLDVVSCSHIVFKGAYGHCGDTYIATSFAQLQDIRDLNIGG